MAENVDCSKSSEQIVAKYRKTPPCGGVLIFLQRIESVRQLHSCWTLFTLHQAAKQWAEECHNRQYGKG